MTMGTSQASLLDLPHENQISWFMTWFRPHFEVWVVYPVMSMIVDPHGGMPAFIWLTCSIDWLSGFWYGEPTKNATKTAYIGFINAYFPKDRYVADDLYDSLRNGLVHMYTIKNKTYALTNQHPQWHLRKTNAGQLLLNLEDFFEDFQSAKKAYFAHVEQEYALLEKLIKRYERDGFLGLVDFEVK